MVSASVHSPFEIRATHQQLRVVVIGAGIAGLAAAYEALKAGHHVRVLDRRSALCASYSTAQRTLATSPSHRSFGTSLPQAETSHDHAVIAALGVEELRQLGPEIGVHECSLIERRGRLILGADASAESVPDGFSVVKPASVAPIISNALEAGVYDRQAYEVRVGTLQEALTQRIEEMYTETLSQRAEHDHCIMFGTRLVAAQQNHSSNGVREWTLISDHTRITGVHAVVNAAGVNADAVDEILGVTPVGHTPKYRSMCLLPVPSEQREIAAQTPIVDVLDERGQLRCFFKPVLLDESGNLDQTVVLGVDDLDSRDVYLQVSPADERIIDCAVEIDDEALNRAITAVREVTGWSFPNAAEIERKYVCPRVYTPGKFTRIGPHSDDPTIIECTGLAGNGFQEIGVTLRELRAVMNGEVSSLPSQLSVKLQARRYRRVRR